MSKNTILSIALAVCIIAAIAVVIYVNLPSDNPKPVEKDILTITYNGIQYNYSLSELKEMEAHTDSGRMIKLSMLPEIVITDSHNYTGTNMTTLLQQLSVTEDNYTLSVHSYDGWISNYTYSMVHGEVSVYNETGSIIPNATAYMLITYAEDGIDYTNESGPCQLRITYVNNHCITSSKLWAKFVKEIEIITE